MARQSEISEGKENIGKKVGSLFGSTWSKQDWVCRTGVVDETLLALQSASGVEDSSNVPNCNLRDDAPWDGSYGG